MSVLWFDGLLARVEDAGVYFLPEPDVEELLEAAAVNRFPVLRVNLRGCADKPDLLLRMAGLLALPPHVVGDWNALAGAFEALRRAGAEGQVLLIEHSEDVRAAEPGEFKRGMESLQAISADWGESGHAFWSFVVLEEAEFEALG
jgi:hypothetical protein